MERPETMQQARDLVLRGSHHSLGRALADCQEPLVLLTGVLYAMGFPYVEAEPDETGIRLSAGHWPGNLMEQVVWRNDQVSGPLAEAMEAAFAIIHSIEFDLDSALLLPPDLRGRRVAEVVRRHGVDSDFFNIVLRNWSGSRASFPSGV